MKTIKEFLFNTHGIDVYLPKEAIKEYFKISDITSMEYDDLLSMIQTRNLLTHIYNELFYEQTLKQLPKYFNILKEVAQFIHSKTE